ncbi:PREDICTED: putative uncharacterized protein DDB_G0277255 [Nicrophorus vespilloides]|uniref:Uncharacterized protein n=1 Tax=Nicrophorus vespilloides TaxID=110193 RepID=A0ABM1MY62_NICVS|nr:PREDICTED: putative uncharacterized protein DDB_G0277255 [Nicrophorus vespilloides]
MSEFEETIFETGASSPPLGKCQCSCGNGVNVYVQRMQSKSPIDGYYYLGVPRSPRGRNAPVCLCAKYEIPERLMSVDDTFVPTTVDNENESPSISYTDSSSCPECEECCSNECSLQPSNSSSDFSPCISEDACLNEDCQANDPSSTQSQNSSNVSVSQIRESLATFRDRLKSKDGRSDNDFQHSHLNLRKSFGNFDPKPSQSSIKSPSLQSRSIFAPENSELSFRRQSRQSRNNFGPQNSQMSFRRQSCQSRNNFGPQNSQLSLRRQSRQSRRRSFDPRNSQLSLRKPSRHVGIGDGSALSMNSSTSTTSLKSISSSPSVSFKDNRPARCSCTGKYNKLVDTCTSTPAEILKNTSCLDDCSNNALALCKSTSTFSTTDASVSNGSCNLTYNLRSNIKNYCCFPRKKKRCSDECCITCLITSRSAQTVDIVSNDESCFAMFDDDEPRASEMVLDKPLRSSTFVGTINDDTIKRTSSTLPIGYSEFQHSDIRASSPRGSINNDDKLLSSPSNTNNTNNDKPKTNGDTIGGHTTTNKTAGQRTIDNTTMVEQPKQPMAANIPPTNNDFTNENQTNRSYGINPQQFNNGCNNTNGMNFCNNSPMGGLCPCLLMNMFTEMNRKQTDEFKALSDKLSESRRQSTDNMDRNKSVCSMASRRRSTRSRSRKSIGTSLTSLGSRGRSTMSMNKSDISMGSRRSSRRSLASRNGSRKSLASRNGSRRSLRRRSSTKSGRRRSSSSRRGRRKMRRRGRSRSSSRSRKSLNLQVGCNDDTCFNTFLRQLFSCDCNGICDQADCLRRPEVLAVFTFLLVTFILTVTNFVMYQL